MNDSPDFSSANPPANGPSASPSNPAGSASSGGVSSGGAASHDSPGASRLSPASSSYVSPRPVGKGRTTAAVLGVTLLAGMVGGAWLMKSYGPRGVVEVPMAGNGAAGSDAGTNPAAAQGSSEPFPYAAPGSSGATGDGTAGNAASGTVPPSSETVSAFESGRIAALEQKVDRINVASGDAGANASRAEGLLVAFAARRAVERGQSLGYIESELRQRFGSAMPRAVATIIEASSLHVTADKLRERLEVLEPALMSADGATPGFWSTLSNLFVVRPENAPSVDPTQRMARAKRALDIGRVDRAIVEVEQLPGAKRAETWLVLARRFNEAQKALDLIESAAIQDPRNLQDYGAPNPLAPAATPPAAPAPATSGARDKAGSKAGSKADGTAR